MQRFRLQGCYRPLDYFLRHDCGASSRWPSSSGSRCQGHRSRVNRKFGASACHPLIFVLGKWLLGGLLALLLLSPVAF